MELKRCRWADPASELYTAYHDQEWGRPEHDDRKLFEMLILEGFQAGLSWLTILKKREAFRRAFDGFDPAVVAAYGPEKLGALMSDPGIVRNRRKIQAAVQNAAAFLKIQQEFGSFDRYLWAFTDGQIVLNTDDQVRASSELSDRISADLKRRGLNFVGTVIIYSFLQAVGVVNDHETGCWCHRTGETPTRTKREEYIMETAQTSHRMDIIVNKQFEVEPFLDALDKCGFLYEKPVESHTPPAGVDRMADFRRKYILGRWEVTIRCIEDMLPPNDPDIVETSGSHSQMKAMLLPGYIRKDKPEVILSVSTAESTPRLQAGNLSQNGCVALGSAYYMYDARRLDPTSPSKLDVKYSVFTSRPSPAVWTALVDFAAKTAPARFQAPPHAPAPEMKVLAYPNAMAVGILNVVHYDVYEKADPVAYTAAQNECGGTNFLVSLETTHGIVATSAGMIPTIFMSPITDRYTKFAEDVDDRQNYVAGYNAGVTAAVLLDALGRMRD